MGGARKSDGGGLIGVGRRDKQLIMARVLSSKDWERPKDIQRARHMAHDRHSLAEIKSALGWDVHENTARNRLKKYNITPHNYSNKSHQGEDTSIPITNGHVTAQNYRPRVMGAR